VDTLDPPSQHVKMRHFSTAELAIQAALELTFALHNPAPAAPFDHVGHQQHEALTRFATTFEEIADPEGPSPDLEQVLAPAPSVTTKRHIQGRLFL
jgi:hypothetical protein